MADAGSDSLASHYAEIYRFVRRRVESDPVAEDLAQQVFLEAVGALKKYDRSGACDVGLLYAIARRRLIDRLRASNRNLVSIDEIGDVASAHEYGPELGRLLAEAIARLEPKQRELVTLRLLRGLSFKEAAAVFGITEAACKMRFRSALETLRHDLEQKGLHP
jgi:RNA polymerase sigma-70 factor, ECF subfamily